MVSSVELGRAVVTRIDAGRVMELCEQRAQLVEVLPKAEYEEEHLPGAIRCL